MDTPIEFDLTISNYRCFSRENPAQIRIRPGFTCFVGVNNAGKSALLRFFYEFRALFQQITNNWAEVVKSRSDWGVSLSLPEPAKDPLECFHSENEDPIEIAIAACDTRALPLRSCKQIRITVQRTGMAYFQCEWAGGDTLYNVIGQGTLFISQTSSGYTFDASFVMRAIILLSSTWFIPAFRNVVNAGGGGMLFDAVVGQHFVEKWDDAKNGSTNKKANKVAAKLSEDIAALLGFKRLDINPTKDRNTLNLIADGRPLRLDEMGSGIAQLILVLATAATVQSQVILIDEPELNLHPTLQRDFLAILGGFASHSTMFTTHNLGLAYSSKAHIYSVTRADGVSRVDPYEKTPRLSELLGMMSYSGYAMIGADKVLLVEGESDFLVFKQFLRLYDKEHKVLILQLSGSEHIKKDCARQLIEIKRICPNIRAIIDSDRETDGGPAKTEAVQFARVCRKLGIPCCLTERTATENYLPERALKKAFRHEVKALGHWERFEQTEVKWAKSDGWRAASEMTLADLEGTDIGDFLKAL